MKKISFLVPVIIVFLILSGCVSLKAAGEHDSFVKLDSNGSYTGFLHLPDNYTPEKALKDGCFVVTEDSEKKDSAKLYGGKEHWDEFLSASSKGENAYIRAVTFLPEGIFYDDLYYSNGQYHYFYYDKNSLSTDLTDKPYKYLRILTDKFGNPPKDSTIYVLTDSLELTFHDVMWSMLSSSMDSRTKIPFHWISFTTYIGR